MQPTPSRVLPPHPQHEPWVRRLGPRAGAADGSACQPTLRPGAGGRHPQVGAAPSGKGGHGTNKIPPMCGQVLYKRGDGGTPGVARGARRHPSRGQGGGLPHPPVASTEIPVARPVRPASPPKRPTTLRPRGRKVGIRSGPGSWRCSPSGVHLCKTGPPVPPVGPPGSRLPTPNGPGPTRGPGCPSRPRGNASTKQLTPGGRRGRRPLAPLLEPAQRPRPNGPIPPGHKPTTPGAGTLYR